MNFPLSIRMFGTPSIQRDDQTVTGFRSGKTQALLYYLASTKRAHTRSALAGLFWSDVAEQHARRSLTTALSNLRQLMGDYIQGDRETVAFNREHPCWLDIEAFDANFAADEIDGLQAAIALYKGDFLEGFYTPDAPDFEQWVLIERSRYRQCAVQSLNRLAELLVAENDPAAAISCLRRLLMLEPWQEGVHRHLMLLLTQSGQRSAALAQFERCRQILREELDAIPDAATIELAERIRSGAIQKIVTPNNRARGDGLPDQSYGRVAAYLQEQLLALKGQAQKKALAEIGIAWDDVLAAWTHALQSTKSTLVAQMAETLWLYCEALGLLQEGQTLFQRAAAAFSPESAEKPLSDEQNQFWGGFLLAGQGWFCTRRGDLRMGRSLMEQGILRLQQSPFRKLSAEGMALVFLGFNYRFQGNFALAEQLGQESLTCFIKAQDTWGEARSYLLRGTVGRWRGDMANAEAHLHRSLTLCHTLGDENSYSFAACNMGSVATARGHYDAAENYLQEAISISQRSDNLVSLANALRECGELAIAQGDYTQAIHFLNESSAIFTQMGSHRDNIFNRVLRGEAMRLLDNRSEAAQQLQAAVEAAKAVGYEGRTIYALIYWGRLLRTEGHYVEAEEALREFMARRGEAPDELTTAIVLSELAATIFKLGQKAEAGGYWVHSLKLAIECELKPLCLDIGMDAASLLIDRQQIGPAVELFTFVEHEPAATSDTRRRAGQWVAKLSAPAPPRTSHATPDWKSLVRQLLAALSVSNQEQFRPQMAHNLPAQSMPFVGRTVEVSDILRQLSDPACRMLTIAGAGGIGKTRLALQVADVIVHGEPALAQMQLDADGSSHRGIQAELTTLLPSIDAADGVWFVPLQSVSSVAEVITAIANALDWRFFGEAAPQDQLLRHIGDKRLLLILDNFEHVLEAAPLISTLLHAAPGLKIITTSRELLRLQEEWFYPLPGLTFPKVRQPQPVSAVATAAVQLFAQHARRAQPTFDLDSELTHIIRICQLVEGVPLALELAAAWLRGLSCEQILQELQQGIDILVARHRNVTARHRSMSAVLEQSWSQLIPLEQQMLSKLAVFQNGFDQDAALAVADTSSFALLTLVEKSMVRSYRVSEEQVRYEITELLRQFVLERSTDLDGLRNAHSRYFANFAQQQYTHFQQRRYRQAIHALSDESDNLRSAWHWLAERLQADAPEPAVIESLSALVTPLVWFYRERSLLWDGKTLLLGAWRAVEQAISQSGAVGKPNEKAAILNLQGQLALGLSQFHYALGEYEQVDQRIGVALPLLHDAELVEEEALALEIAARSSLRRGHNEDTKRLAQQSIDVAEKAGSELRAVEAIVILARLAADEGDYDRAIELHSRAVVIYRSLGYALGTARALVNLGCTYRWQGNAAAARPLQEEAYALAQKLNNPFLIMFAAINRGYTLSALSEWDEAEAFFQESLLIARESNEKRWVAANLNGMSLTYRCMGQLDAAERCVREALHLAYEIQVIPDVLESIAFLAHVWMERGRQEPALRALLFVEEHPATLATDRDLNIPVLASLRSALSAADWAEAEAWQQAQTLPTVIQWIQAL